MQKKALTCVVSVVTFLHAIAQADKKDTLVSTNNIRGAFSMQLFAGMQVGENDRSVQALFAGGLRYRKWFAGMGAGIDDYYFQSIPVYLTGARFLSAGQQGFFLQGALGLCLPAAGELTDPARGWGDIVSTKLKPGFYWNGSVNFAAVMSRNHSLFIGLGYGYKFLKEVQEIAVTCVSPPCDKTYEIYKYRLKSLSLKLGWQFSRFR